MPGVILTLDLFFLLVQLIQGIYFLSLGLDKTRQDKTRLVVVFVGGLVGTLVGCVLVVYCFIVIRSYRFQDILLKT